MIRNLLLTFILLVLSGFVLWMTVTRLDPLGINQIPAYFSFFVSFFLSISLFFTFVFFFASEMRRRQKLGTRHYLVALRRGALSGFFGSGIVVLQLMRIVSLVGCEDRFTPETGCSQVVFIGSGLFEIILWGVFLVLIEYICLSANKNKS